MTNRDGNRFIPVSDGNRHTVSVHRNASVPFPVPDSELPTTNTNESDSSREMGSFSAPCHTTRCNYGLHSSGSGLTISAPNYEEVVTSSGSRSTSRVQVPSPSFHQPSVTPPPSTPPPSYRSGGSSQRSTPPPSYQEVIEREYSEPPPAYQQTVLQPEHSSSSNEGPWHTFWRFHFLSITCGPTYICQWVQYYYF